MPTLTVETICDDLRPHVEAAILTEVPAWARWVVRTLLPILLRLVVWVLIGRYGVFVGPLLGVLIGSAGTYLRPEVLGYLSALEDLVDTPPQAMPRYAAKARAVAAFNPEGRKA